MKSLDTIEKSKMDDFNELESWCKVTYKTHFQSFFEGQRSIGLRMSNSGEKITDEELEQILIDIPLSLIDVSEKINMFKLRIQALKLSIKEKTLSPISENSKAIDQDILEDKLLVSAYEAVIQRVEKEMSYSRELIMGAKKVWESRRNTDAIMPVAPVESRVDDLPEYPIRR